MDYSAMTDEEFFIEVDKLFGEEHTVNDIMSNPEVYREFVKRTSTGTTMIDFNRKPMAKSAEEMEFDRLNKQYEAKFGESYFFQIGIDSGSWKEVLADIRRRIANNDPKREVKYKEGYDY